MKTSLKYKAGIIVSAAALLLATYAFSKDDVIVVRGAISDSQCAFNVHSDSHSHDWMIKKKVYGAGDDKSCTLKCVKEMGGKYVLVGGKEVYRLDDQTMPEKFAGAKVKVTGTLDEKTQTLRVMKIEADK